jgi:DNA repair protein RadC
VKSLFNRELGSLLFCGFPFFLEGRDFLMSKKRSVEVVRLQMIREHMDYYSTKKVNRPSDVAEVVRRFINSSDREMFVAVHLATDNRIASVHLISLGTLNQSLIHPRECFKAALLCNAQSVVFAHNHPSGNLEPSVEDREITRKLRECGEVLEIKVLDALIVSDEGYFSFVENSLL